ncbi:hypothetical protein GCM10020358_53020 [Amorphoplanes nipponensis]|uniref:Uncharacterized protein n=1 Tax=Actinoplanes nipponensis TaxID=135950 RepID=A0A919JF51_9ACTN|nr:hypothetical protein [Actinoplanes nipponensis]GIE49558.1 hypothetical protein Ani05nite_30920 [Actinoplanes nipponensis]
MSTFMLIWDASEAGYPPANLAADIAATAAGGLVRGRWSFGSRRGGTAPGDRVFLLRQRRDRGIVASGTLADGEIFAAAHWQGHPAKRTYYADVLWERVVAVADRLPFEELAHQVPGHDWRHIYGSGQRVHPPADVALERRWAGHLAGLRP